MEIVEQENDKEEDVFFLYRGMDGEIRWDCVPLKLRHYLSLKYWEKEQLEEGYDSEEEGSRPVRQEWPAESILDKSHFTIDEQHCLKCRKKLGYALPMNKEPNVKYLFCCNEDGSPKCRLQADYLECWACGNLNTQTTGHVVNRPANCAYYEPTQIYDFMCAHCHKDMMEQEPGKEECAEQLKKIRELRREDKIRGGGGAGSTPFTQFMNSTSYSSSSSSSSIYSHQSSLPEDRGSRVKRKRVFEKEAEKEKEEETCSSEKSLVSMEIEHLQ